MYGPKAHGYTTVSVVPHETYIGSPPLSQHYSPYPSLPIATYVHRKSRRWADYPSIFLVAAIWGFLVTSCLILLYATRVGVQANSESGKYITVNEVMKAISLSTIPLLFATILNEVLVERCWRRVEMFALGRNPFGRDVVNYDPLTMATHLRAANFGWYKFLRRLFTLKLSFRDVRTLISWLWLRGGTAIAIASTQLCVSWTIARNATNDSHAPEYDVHTRPYWVLLPPTIHALATFGTVSFIWFELPWALFSDRFNNEGLWDSYVPYLQRLQAGSAASSDDAAKLIEHPELSRDSLARVNKPGVQFLKKLRGVWFGLLMMFVPPLLACLHNSLVHTDKSTILRTGLYRFVFHLVFLAQNIFYVVVLDFIIWNLSLEGLCRPGGGGRSSSSSSSKSAPKPKSGKLLDGLGKSAGLLLVGKAFRQRRRPARAAVFTWLFWLQACAMRFLTVVYIFCIEIVSYGSIQDRMTFYDPQFWLGWVILTAMVTYPLVFLWLLWPFQAPVCEQDGWRWANVLQTVHARPWLGRDGWYGVAWEKDAWGNTVYKATWGTEVMSFNDAKGKKLA